MSKLSSFYKKLRKANKDVDFETFGDDTVLTSSRISDLVMPAGYNIFDGTIYQGEDKIGSIETHSFGLSDGTDMEIDADDDITSNSNDGSNQETNTRPSIRDRLRRNEADVDADDDIFDADDDFEDDDEDDFEIDDRNISRGQGLRARLGNLRDSISERFGRNQETNTPDSVSIDDDDDIFTEQASTEELDEIVDNYTDELEDLADELFSILNQISPNRQVLLENQLNKMNDDYGSKVFKDYDSNFDSAFFNFNDNLTKENLTKYIEEYRSNIKRLISDAKRTLEAEVKEKEEDAKVVLNGSKTTNKSEPAEEMYWDIAVYLRESKGLLTKYKDMNYMFKNIVNELDLKMDELTEILKHDKRDYNRYFIEIEELLHNVRDNYEKMKSFEKTLKEEEKVAKKETTVDDQVKQNKIDGMKRTLDDVENRMFKIGGLKIAYNPEFDKLSYELTKLSANNSSIAEIDALYTRIAEFYAKIGNKYDEINAKNEEIEKAKQEKEKLEQEKAAKELKERYGKTSVACSNALKELCALKDIFTNEEKEKFEELVKKYNDNAQDLTLKDSSKANKEIEEMNKVALKSSDMKVVIEARQHKVVEEKKQRAAETEKRRIEEEREAKLAAMKAQAEKERQARLAKEEEERKAAEAKAIEDKKEELKEKKVELIEAHKAAQESKPATDLEAKRVARNNAIYEKYDVQDIKKFEDLIGVEEAKIPLAQNDLDKLNTDLEVLYAMRDYPEDLTEEQIDKLIERKQAEIDNVNSKIDGLKSNIKQLETIIRVFNEEAGRRYLEEEAKEEEQARIEETKEQELKAQEELEEKEKYRKEVSKLFRNATDEEISPLAFKNNNEVRRYVKYIANSDDPEQAKKNYLEALKEERKAIERRRQLEEEMGVIKEDKKTSKKK